MDEERLSLLSGSHGRHHKGHTATGSFLRIKAEQLAGSDSYGNGCEMVHVHLHLTLYILCFLTDLTGCSYNFVYILVGTNGN